MPSSVAIIMCTTIPSTRVPQLNVAPSGAPRHRVWAIRLSGAQNPTPVSHSTIIDHIAIIAPPSIPPSAPERSACRFMSPPGIVDLVANSRRGPPSRRTGNVTAVTVFGRAAARWP
jgi:hypothetical protein